MANCEKCIIHYILWYSFSQLYLFGWIVGSQQLFSRVEPLSYYQKKFQQTYLEKCAILPILYKRFTFLILFQWGS
jgi:hypothetical protein